MAAAHTDPFGTYTSLLLQRLVLLTLTISGTAAIGSTLDELSSRLTKLDQQIRGSTSPRSSALLNEHVAQVLNEFRE
jgi:hypothetical protein